MQTVGAFGRNPAAMPPMPAFGNGFAPSPAQSMPTAGPFSGSSTGFGMHGTAFLTLLQSILNQGSVAAFPCMGPLGWHA